MRLGPPKCLPSASPGQAGRQAIFVLFLADAGFCVTCIDKTGREIPFLGPTAREPPTGKVRNVNRAKQSLIESLDWNKMECAERGASARAGEFGRIKIK